MIVCAPCDVGLHELCGNGCECSHNKNGADSEQKRPG